MDEERPSEGLRGRMTRVYDVFVDWEGRLARELPGIERHLAACGARRVLDLGCGTGRHVEALLARGYDAHGADSSPDMLERAAERLGSRDRLHAWDVTRPPPAAVERLAPFDALMAMGNVWPFLVLESDVRAAASHLRAILRPGGLVLFGLKAFEVRRRSGVPHLPLMRRLHEGRHVWFLRFVDFDVPAGADGVQACELHMAVVGGSAREADEQGEGEALLHRVSRLRSWDPSELARWLEEQGFTDVRVSGRLDDPTAAVTGEDVFASARVPELGR